MSQARCILQVQGLDCSSEVESLRVALHGQPGVVGLGFDLIHGTMTVDYVDGAVDPDLLVRLISERAGLSAAVKGRPEGLARSWWSMHERWVLTAGSGLALAVGLTFSWLGVWFGMNRDIAGRLAAASFLSAVLVGGVGLFPRATRNIQQLRLDIDVLMGLAILGALALGQWDEAATVAFLYGLSESLEAFSLDHARRSIRALLDLTPQMAERIMANGTVRASAGDPGLFGRSSAGSARRHDTGGRRNRRGAIERRSKDDHR